jgi:hypothetical protein
MFDAFSLHDLVLGSQCIIVAPLAPRIDIQGGITG